MARVKGGLGAKKKHNRVLKLAKGYRGARSKQYRVAKQSVMSLGKFLCGAQGEKETVPSALDRAYQRCGTSERTFLQPVYARLKAGRG